MYYHCRKEGCWYIPISGKIGAGVSPLLEGGVLVYYHCWIKGCWYITIARRRGAGVFPLLKGWLLKQSIDVISY